jgi:hypothetical protein
MSQPWALPTCANACLTDQPVVLENLPSIADVAVMQEILLPQKTWHNPLWGLRQYAVLRSTLLQVI